MATDRTPDHPISEMNRWKHRTSTDPNGDGALEVAASSGALALAPCYLSPKLQRLVAAAKAVVEIDALYDELGYKKDGLEWDCALIELSSALRSETDNVKDEPRGGL